jgi:hypothetical protein
MVAKINVLTLITVIVKVTDVKFHPCRTVEIKLRNEI